VRFENISVMTNDESHKKAFQTFEDLETYQAARAFRKEMYAVARKLPDLEKFGLCGQIRRAAVSLTNNIAEGHGRYHYLDQAKFGLQARGSLQELIDDLNVCSDEKYLRPEETAAHKQHGWRVLNLINGYLRYLRNQQNSKTSTLHEPATPYITAAEDPLAGLDLEPFTDVTM
jgi:four helix bundle protein